MSSTQLDRFAEAALTALLARGDFDDADALAREAFRIARAMMSERARQDELPDSGLMDSGVLDQKIEKLDLPLRILKKLRGIGIDTIRDLTLTTDKAVRDTGLGDESLAEIRGALHRHGLILAAT
ncbi:MAG: hypothetical protein K8I27_13660 [Planctomycetes bacterium]|nr:hypothetical protein [Planctomycetota bacterium]